MKYEQYGAFALCATALLAQTPPSTILEVDIENLVLYYLDVTDPSKLATSAAPMLTGPGRIFRWQVALADVTAVNGAPAKGLYAGRSMPLQSAPRPGPGQAIADIGSFGLNDAHLVILQPDGTEIGSLFGIGVGGAAAPPGAPRGAAVHNFAVAGGTGAFLGARGQWSFKEALGGANRSVSMTEDTANRRTHGGGRRRDIIQLLPMSWPEVMADRTGPAIYHSSDMSPVTSAAPTRVGEWLILRATGLGPTRPGVDLGKPFPQWEAGKEHIVNSPVEVEVGRRATEVRNAVGWPGMVNQYRVDFQVPESTPPGDATVALRAAWVTGPEVQIPVR
jgi:hypothetical protein